MMIDREAMRRHCQNQPDDRVTGRCVVLSRPGFTLVELLVAMTIILIVAGLALRMLYLTLDSDRLSSGSRELQAFLTGARDRAAYAAQPRGVRFIPDKNDPTTVSSFVYIGAPSNYSEGTITLVDQGAGLPSTISQWPVTWGPQAITTTLGFRDRGLLPDGSRIQIPASSGQWYTLAYNSSATPPAWGLTTRYAGGTFGANITYVLELAGAVLPGDAPRQLPQGVVVDLDNSVLPVTWVAPYTNPPLSSPPSYATPLDILFSPQGNVIGPPASDGRVHFVLSAIADVAGDAPIVNLTFRNRLNAPWQAGQSYALGNVIVPTPTSFIAYRCTTAGTSGTTAPTQFITPLANQTVSDNTVVWQSFVKKTSLIVSVATASGRVTTSPADVSDALTPGPGYDTFRLAEYGEVTQ
jgi:prepilin-type N-terminal cleavage/methylation domain-containing protein